MLEISVMAIAPWDELKKRLETEDPNKVEIMDYIQIKPDSPELPESNSIHEEFFDHWYSILERCPEELKEGIQNVFMDYFYTRSTSTKDWINSFELPLRAYRCGDSIWSWVHCALSPETVQQLAAHAAKFDIDLYEPHFRSKRSGWLRSFEDFKEYAQTWLALIREAADFKTGMIITIV